MKLNWTFETDLEKAGLKAAKLLQSQGFQALWVGGVIRNQILKIKSDNLDIATNALPDQVVLLLSKEKIYIKPIGKQFGSILAIVQGQKIEITTFRKEGFYSDNRHPDQVQFIHDFLEDAKRRDFTINAMYFDPVTKELFDPMKGIKDLKFKLLRFVGDPKKRIDEDGLRMLRGVRLATQLDFKLEKNTFAAIKTRAKYIQEISGERIKAELDKILLSENRLEGLRLLSDIGLLKFLSPELEQLKKITHKSKIYHLEGDVFEHTLLCLKSLPGESELDLVYALLFHDTGKALTGVPKMKDEGLVVSFPEHPKVSAEVFSKFADRLRFPKQSKQLIEWLILAHDDWRKLKSLSEDQIISMVLDERFQLLQKLWLADISGNIRTDKDKSDHQMGYTQAMKYSKAVDSKRKLIEALARGGLIMKYGKMRPGPDLGRKIHEVKIQIVLGKIKSEKDLAKYLTT